MFKLRKIAVLLLSLIMGASLFAACNSGGSGSTAPTTSSQSEAAGEAPAENPSTDDGGEAGDAASPSPAGELTYKGDITFYAQAYQPVEPTEAKPNPPTAFRTVAEAYQALHPDIKIDFITSVPGDDYNTWLKTKLSAGMAPDVVWAQNSNLTGETFPKGSMVDLRSYMDSRPNPYVEGNTVWNDLFHQSLQDQLYDSNGELWQVNGDFVATAVVYNMDMFAEAGITEIPENWTEFIEVCKKLQEKGHTPWAFPLGNDADSMDKVTWLGRLFYTNYYGEDFDKLAVMGSETSLTPLEVAIAFKNGTYDVRDPKYLHFWQFLKEQTAYMPTDFLSPTQNGKAVLNMFVNENIAMYFDGSWATNDLKLANPSFEFGMFPFPVPEQSTDSYATSVSSKNSIGGPSAAFQFAIPSQMGNKSLSDEKLEACLDWLMYITTPENNSLIVNDLGSFVPTVVGATAQPGSEAILESLNDRALMLEGGTMTLGVTYLDAYYRTYQEYLGDKITLEEAAERLAPLAEQAADKIITDSGVDVSQYLNS